MGRLTDGSINIYGKGREQIDVAKQNRLNNPNGSHTTLGILGTALLPNLLSGIACQVADSNCGGAGSSVSKSNSQEVTPDSLKKTINEKLTEVNCKDFESLTSELADLQGKQQGLDDAFNAADLKVQKLNQDISSYSKIIQDGEASYNELRAKPASERTPEEQDFIDGYEINKAYLEKLNKTDLPAAQSELSTAETAKINNTKRIGDLQDAKRVLEPLVKQLQELELTNAVDQYKNKESKKILSLIKKLNSETDQNKRVQLARELGAAVEAYYANHKKGECPTIDNLPAAKNYLQVKNFKPEVPAFELPSDLGFGQRKVS
ncbi:MAG: hypothetical protein NC408_00845 [Candidatus Gastranaerophilales bacterium]|nr:hypothetical protein [Candidatus Gastranaerophilales bacterium]MCM1072919.1 hypothetical protein [Bacteroides sp.]